MQLWKAHARRIAALVCTLAMMACLLPSAAFATGTELAAQPGTAQGETADNAKDTPQNKPENSTGDKAASTATDSTGDKTASTTTGNAGDKTGDTTEDTTGTQGEPDSAPVATALNSLAAAPEAKQARKTEGEGAEIWFYIAKPGNTTLPGDKDAYYFLTRGGSASSKAAGMQRDMSVTNVGDEAAITGYATAFPTQLMQGWLPGASEKIDNGSTWSINATTGEVETFDLVLDGTHYTSDQWGIRWVKFSNAQATPDDPAYRYTYHMDAMLYDKITVQDVLNQLNPKKIVNGKTYDAQGNEITSGTFTYTMTSTDHPKFSLKLKSSYDSIYWVPKNIEVANEANKSLELLPGTYVITEDQDPENLKVFRKAATIQFNVNRDGTVSQEDGERTQIVNYPNIYTLTYAANASDEQVSGLPATETYLYNQVATISTQEPTREGYWFKGWSTEPGEDRPLYDGKTIQIQGNVTLYAQWEPMYTFTLQPANMTIYVGGSGTPYGGIVDDKGDPAGDSSLPEPGFYFTLPPEVNTELNQALNVTDPSAAVDLSKYVTVTATDDDGSTRNWTLEPYGSKGEGGSSTAKLGEDGQERFVYRIVPATGQEPIRVQIKNGGTVVISDRFEPSKALYAEYDVSLYTGTLEPEDIVMTITVPQAGSDSASLVFRCQYDAVNSQTGTLTVRHASKDAPTTPAAVGEDELAEKIEGDPHSFYVQVEDTQTFYLNETNDGTTEGITVAHDDVSLLADNIFSTQDNDYEQMLNEKAQQQAAFGASKAESMYLDLVDASNGNAWLTPAEGGAVTVFWPYPDGMNQNSTLQLYHFEGLDRQMDLSEIEGALDTAKPEVVKITKGKNGITFETDSFSPFVLVCDTTPAPQPSTGGGSSDTGSSQSSTVTVTATAPAPTPAPTAKPAAAAAVIPQTGDDMPVGLLAGLAIVAAGGLAALLVVRKRRGDR